MILVVLVASVEVAGEVGRGRVLSKKLSRRTAFFGTLAAVLLAAQLLVLKVSFPAGGIIVCSG